MSDEQPAGGADAAQAPATDAPHGHGAPGGAAGADPDAKKRLTKHLTFYTLARMALFAALAAVIEGVGYVAVGSFPLLLALLLALVLSLPLSMVLFKSLRVEVNRDIAAVDANRRAHREDLEAKLRGERR